MSLSDYKSLIGNVAVLTTMLQFLSGILVCKQYVVNRTTAEASPLPFLCGVLSSGLWLLYGVIKQDKNIVFVNTIGVILMVTYVVVFYMYTFKKSSLLKQIFGCVAFALLVLCYTFTEEDVEILQSRLGLSACSLTLLTVGAPLSKLFYVIKVQNTECLPFPMILMSFFVSTLWMMYGVIEEDIFLVLPNFIGAVLALSQLSLFVIFSSRPQSPGFSKDVMGPIA